VVAAIADHSDATRRIVGKRVAADYAAGKIFAFCGTRFAVHDI